MAMTLRLTDDEADALRMRAQREGRSMQEAAALLHSLARNHALVDGNKRVALAATLAFYGMNGQRLTFTNDAAYDFVIDVATGRLDDVPAIASVLERHTQAR